MGGAQANLRRIMSMARRPFRDEPMSKVAVWSSRLGLFAFAVAALSIIIVRSGLLEIVPALATFAAALVFAGLAILLAFGGFHRDLAARAPRPWPRASRFVSRLGAARLSRLSRHSSLEAAGDFRHHDRHGQSSAFRCRSRVCGRVSAIDYPGPAVAALQRAAYPDLRRWSSMSPPKVAYDAALALVTKRKWLDRRCAPADIGAPRWRNRGRSTHADHGIPRRCRDPRDPDRPGHPRRHALGLALRHPRSSAPMRRAYAACSKISTTPWARRRSRVRCPRRKPPPPKKASQPEKRQPAKR